MRQESSLFRGLDMCGETVYFFACPHDAQDMKSLIVDFYPFGCNKGCHGYMRP